MLRIKRLVTKLRCCRRWLYGLAGPGRADRSFDVNFLTPTPPMDDAERTRRYRKNLVAELTKDQAGL